MRGFASPGFHEPTAPVRTVIGDDRVALAGPLGEVVRHRHASAAIVVGVDAPLRVVAGRTHGTRAALLAPGFAHSLEVRGRLAVFILPVHAVACRKLVDVTDLPSPHRWIEYGGQLAQGELDDFAVVDREIDRACVAPRSIDDRLRRALVALEGSLDENVEVERIAEAARLSPSRLMALAREQIRTSFRSYRRWLRAFHVARRYALGASLTQAALEAGFASSAHLSAAARKQFGVCPSQILSPRTRGLIKTL
jgi:AraC-like DNA-binding protein